MDHRRRLARSPPRRRGRGLAAALLLAPSALAATPFLGRYHASEEVDGLATLDLDVREVANRFHHRRDAVKMQKAMEVYEGGREHGPAADTTLKALGAGAAGTLEGSPTFKAYEGYYGAADYADRWVRAAFGGNSTGFAEGRDFDFGAFGLEERAAAIQRGMVVLHIWINVVGRLEVVAGLCPSDGAKKSALLHEWDSAVALYVGSRARDDGKDGHLLYTLAQTECAMFGTCGTGDMAAVNDRILDAFKNGKKHLREADCDAVARSAAHIKRLMTVPLVQGTLRAVHTLDRHPNGELAQGRAAAMVASVLPLVDECDGSRGPDRNAQILHGYLAPGKASTGSFEAVKAALERSYGCLGVHCPLVGGVLASKGKEGYAEGAEPCVHLQPMESDEGPDDTKDDTLVHGEYDRLAAPSTESGTGSANSGLLSGFACVVFGFVLGAAVTAAYQTRKQKEKQAAVEFVSPADGNVPASTPGVRARVQALHARVQALEGRPSAPLGVV